MSAIAAACLVAVLYVLHQDVWFWHTAQPFVLGFLPIGLFYHAAFTVACSVLMWLLVRCMWPAHLEPASEQRAPFTE
jgi:nitric oxide reductase large subunit